MVIDYLNGDGLARREIQAATDANWNRDLALVTGGGCAEASTKALACHRLSRLHHLLAVLVDQAHIGLRRPDVSMTKPVLYLACRNTASTLRGGEGAAQSVRADRLMNAGSHCIFLDDAANAADRERLGVFVEEDVIIEPARSLMQVVLEGKARLPLRDRASAPASLYRL